MTPPREPRTMPLVVLHTERLTLRAHTRDDIDPVHRAATDPELQRWLPLPRPGRPYTRADAEHWCLVAAPESRAAGDGQQWAIVETATGGYCGAVGLTRTMWRAATTEVGYWLSPAARGRGLATEAAVAVAHWALRDQRFQRVELKAATGNTASRRVAEKAGFVYEGTERNAMPLHRGRTDLAVYSLIPADLTGLGPGTR
ncbi:GNAT family N-acetyltransferase [Streptomonospora nanhaiensis]|uniref:RimJ/RimL family protein N-acetyltransferase n=1 Tax=Streptomonospora nanhaiensis TaxID=1323731 RepID=A0A853BW63_9ACTN|nr:GNAT family N-acetyltransferase [Streptomonospora nanhaiensis]MBV2365487.1 GNAT family N-acetyltransferase [Streptomonospora nanhaiensis]MBX9390815.1 GNAT family N-acetyltransferase [Streptomonospora nanhaiensis]NYI98432.1 RimJ/RimL family protein N-acetyltransferase [Streptomonospora nanhaiensis]